MSRPTFISVVNDVLFMNGNREDLLDAAKTAVRDSIAVTLSIHHMNTLNAVARSNVPTIWPYAIPKPDDCEAITMVHYYDEDEDKWIPLEEGSAEEVFSYEENIPSISKPEKYIEFAHELWISPKTDHDYSVMLLYKRDPQYPVADNEELWDVPVTLLPTVKQLAAAILRVIQGETEIAGTMRNFAAMFGSDKFGPQAKKAHRQNIGMKVEGL